ncbi:MAG TPA: hypothetical protein VJ553_00800 [Candidatus Paceibacterota bacterium]|nr:hypothetical protein [Candidatus Paceibacterota bacterium]
MKRTILPIALLCAIPALAQQPEAPDTAWFNETAMAFTDPLPEGAVNIESSGPLTYQRILVLKTVAAEYGTLHVQLLRTGLCVAEAPCEFAINVQLRQDKPVTDDAQVLSLRYVFLSKLARVEGIGCFWKAIELGRYWQRLNGATWSEFGTGTPEFQLEEAFIAGTWDFAVEGSKE